MNQKQSFNLNADFLNGFASLFMKLVFVIILIYLLIMILNFLRDKFINKEVNTEKANISDLLAILNKLFFLSGFGFAIGNILSSIFSQISGHHNNMNLNGGWANLTFGVILIFIGIGFKEAIKVLKKEH
jgi:hypothetical protein